MKAGRGVGRDFKIGDKFNDDLVPMISRMKNKRVQGKSWSEGRLERSDRSIPLPM